MGKKQAITQISTTLGERKKAGGGGGEGVGGRSKEMEGGVFEEINNRNIREMKRGE